MAAIIGVAFELADHMLRREPHDAKAAADFATALFLGGVHAVPQAPLAASGNPDAT